MTSPAWPSGGNFTMRSGPRIEQAPKHRAMDVVPAGDRTKFVAKVKSLIPLPGSGVAKIIPKGVLHEPVDHVEFTFPVTG